MPVLEIAGIEEERGFNCAYLMSVMLYPKDEAARQTFFKSIIAASAETVLLRSGASNELSLEEKLELMHLARASSHLANYLEFASKLTRLPIQPGESSHRKLHAGRIAGHMLLVPLVANLKHGLRIGRNAVYRLLGKANDMGSLKGKRNFQKIWSHYESCAHLWAAFEVCPSFPNDYNDQCTDFLSIARLIQEWASEFRPLRRGAPLLNREGMWEIPDNLVTSIEVNLEGFDLPEQWLTSLRE